MTDREATFIKVIDNPEDDTARLVHADAVQEDGEDSLATLIRVGVLCHCTQDVLGLPECQSCNNVRWNNRCEHEDCRMRGYECFITTYDDENADIIDGWYCSGHAALHGFCPTCGTFCAGIGSFEATGMCDECRDAARDDEWMEDEYAPDWEDDGDEV